MSRHEMSLTVRSATAIAAEYSIVRRTITWVDHPDGRRTCTQETDEHTLRMAMPDPGKASLPASGTRSVPEVVNAPRQALPAPQSTPDLLERIESIRRMLNPAVTR